MACILSISGRRWDVDDFAARSLATPDRIYRRGEMTEGRGAYRVKVSGMSWTLGPKAFVVLSRQVRAAMKFFEDVRNRRWLRAAAREQGVERTLEFGLPRMEGPVHSDYLPARLLELVARYDFEIVVSHYPVKPATGRERRDVRKTRRSRS